MAAIAITAANVVASAQATIISNRNFGATVTAGQAVYLDPTALTWKLIDADAAVTGNELTTTKGIALNGGSSGQPASVAIADPDFTPGGTLVNGSPVNTHPTAGAIAHDVQITPQYPTVLGVAKSTTKMVLRPVSTGVVI